jgi:hypothetical protein
MTALGLVLTVVESLHPGALRALIRYWRDLAIPEGRFFGFDWTSLRKFQR